MKKKTQSKKVKTPKIVKKNTSTVSKENKSKAIGMLLVSALFIAIAIFITRCTEPKIDSLNKLVGDYIFYEEVTNKENITQTYIVKATFNKDYTATYEMGNGSNIEMTKGTFTFKDEIVTYTKEYYNMPDDNSEYKNDIDRIVIFNIKGSKLVQEDEYYEQVVTLERVD